jgi:hypothetical protein
MRRVAGVDVVKLLDKSALGAEMITWLALRLVSAVLLWSRVLFCMSYIRTRIHRVHPQRAKCGFFPLIPPAALTRLLRDLRAI